MEEDLIIPSIKMIKNILCKCKMRFSLKNNQNGVADASVLHPALLIFKKMEIFGVCRELKNFLKFG